MKLSVIILTFNSERTLARTLEAAAQVSDDLHVVDSFSTDGTLAIAERFGAQVVQRPFESYGEQRNWAITHLPLRHDWQLHLDADEYLTDELVAEINALRSGDVDGYLVPRKLRFLGRLIEHGGLYPTWHMRLFRKGKARCELRRYDQHFILEGRGQRLHHPMIDDHRMPLGEWTARHNRWAEAEAAELIDPQKEGVIAGRWLGDPIERKRALRGAYNVMPPLLRPFLFFLYRYFVRLGFLDGKPGLIYIALQTFWYRLLVDAKRYERLTAPKGDAAVDKPTVVPQILPRRTA
jgi:glycosyltransferase involved in cell wall biosynthesis